MVVLMLMVYLLLTTCKDRQAGAAADAGQNQIKEYICSKKTIFHTIIGFTFMALIFQKLFFQYQTSRMRYQAQQRDQQNQTPSADKKKK